MYHIAHPPLAAPPPAPPPFPLPPFGFAHDLYSLHGLLAQAGRGTQPVARLHVQPAVLARDERGLPVHLGLELGRG